MASLSKSTTDHEEIKRWAEERGGKPAHVSGTGEGGDVGLLRLEFPSATGSHDDKLDEISWEQFFEKFNEQKLALVYEEKTASGERSNFNKLVSAESVKSPAKKKKAAAKSSGAKAAKKPVSSKKHARTTDSRPAPKSAEVPLSSGRAGSRPVLAAKKKTAVVKKKAAAPARKSPARKTVKRAVKGSTKKAAGRRR